MASTGYVIPVDPSELSTRFATRDEDDPKFDQEDDNDRIHELELVSDEAVAAFFAAAGDDYEDKIVPLLDKLPEREADFIHLYYIQGKRQADIATIFGVTQAAVSYRLDRGIKRIKFMLSIPQVTEEDLRQHLPRVFSQEIDVNILVEMWRTICQTEVANTLGLTQGRVRHRFIKAVQVLKEACRGDVDLEPMSKIFSYIVDNKSYNATRFVKLPQWSNRGLDQC